MMPTILAEAGWPPLVTLSRVTLSRVTPPAGCIWSYPQHQEPMPIRADYRKYYDARWRKFRLAMLQAAGNVCERCGKPHRLLNVAHLSHDPADRSLLAVLCPSCHSKHDTPQRIAMTRRTRAQKRGQLWLSDEMRLAPFPLRTWPLALRQLDLF